MLLREAHTSRSAWNFRAAGVVLVWNILNEIFCLHSERLRKPAKGDNGDIGEWIAKHFPDGSIGDLTFLMQLRHTQTLLLSYFFHS